MTDEIEIAEPKVESSTPVAPPPPVHVDVVGRGGKPPVDPPALLDVLAWAATLPSGSRFAGFVHSVRDQEPSRRSAAEWAKAMAEFKASPVKR